MRRAGFFQEVRFHYPASQKFGDIVVECLEEDDGHPFIRRVFDVSCRDESRKIIQFQYTRWVS